MPTTEFKGFLFNNSDSTANPNLAKTVNLDASPEKGWGAIVTPDEIRMIYFMGNSRLVTQDGTYLTDEAIKGWIDNTTRAICEELKWDIYPKLWRHRPIIPNQTRSIEEHAHWDDSYSYRKGRKNWHFVKLRHRPIIRVEKWLFNNPYTDHKILNLLPNCEINYEGGTIKNIRWGGFDDTGQGVNGTGRLPLRSARVQHFYDDLPNAYFIDYVTGYDQANRVPSDLRELVAKVLSIKIMSAYGDGIVSGLASFSIGVGALRESVNTTMSATSAFFGARIKQFQEEIKDWYQTNKNRYNHPSIAHL